MLCYFHLKHTKHEQIDIDIAIHPLCVHIFILEKSVKISLNAIYWNTHAQQLLSSANLHVLSEDFREMGLGNEKG